MTLLISRANQSHFQIKQTTKIYPIVFPASSVGLSAMLGFFISSFLMDWYGRKLAYALVILPGTIGWATIYFAADFTTLMAGRVLGGITSGATVTLGAVVIGEYTSPEHRGMFLNLKTAAVCFGNTVVHVLGHYYHWRTVALSALVPQVLAFLNVCTWPESPAWLASKKLYDKSEKAFIWLRGSSEEGIHEHHQLVKAQKERMTNQKQSIVNKLVEFFKKFGRKDFLKPCVIIVFGAVLVEACGRHVFPAYASVIVGEISGDTTQSFLYTICLDLIITASAVSSSVLVKMMKRRTLLFISGLTSLVVLSCVCIYLFLVHKTIVSNTHTWVPISMLILYFILVNLGCTPIPYGFLGEVFPLAHRGAGSAVSGITLSILLMLPLKITPYLLSSVGLHGTFTVFGAAMIISLLALYFILPETKDRTLQEIEDYFNYGRFRDHKSLVDDGDAKIKMLIS